MIIKPKNNLKLAPVAINLAVLIAILWQTVSPTIVLAQESENEVVLTQTQADRMFYPNTAKKANLKVKAVITAYTSTVDQTDDDPFIAASGKRVYDGMIAANWLPMGTKIKIPAIYGDKVFTVHDRMNKRYGYGRMDIWLDTTKAEARKFGVKRVEVEVYYPEKAPVQLAIEK